MNSKREIAELKVAIDLTDKLLPQEKKSKRLIEDPNVTLLKTDKELPALRKDLKEKLDPTCKKSKIEA